MPYLQSLIYINVSNGRKRLKKPVIIRSGILWCINSAILKAIFIFRGSIFLSSN